MGAETKISWTHHTFNIVIGCSRVSEGCRYCYAERLAFRYADADWNRGGGRKTLSDGYWKQPHKWSRDAQREGVQRRVFCSSLCDVFEKHRTTGGQRARLWPVVKATPWLDWLILTKRPENIAATLPDDWGDGYRNVWLGVSVESPDVAHRLDTLRATPAVLRFCSYEPALADPEGIDWNGIDWVIYGGESGPQHRPDKLEWRIGIRDTLAAHGIPLWYKQGSGTTSETDILLDGVLHRELPPSPAMEGRSRQGMLALQPADPD